MRKIPVIGIGASAGGLKEFERFFKQMPAGKEIAIVLIQHLAPDHKSILAEIVKRYTEMEVFQVENKIKVEAGKVYIIPPNNLLTISKGKLLLTPMQKDHGRYLPIDIFFRSLKESLGEKAIAVILSGTGSDGMLGIREVKEAGGLTIVQQPETAEYDGMPTSAIKTGLIDFILPVEEMPDLILSYIENDFIGPKIIKLEDAKTVSYLDQIFNLIQQQIGHDFTYYKRNTILRRIERRLSVHKLDNLKDYIELLKANPNEIGILYKELLISVTSFFRDIETFKFIEKNIIEKIVSQAENQTIRIWVPACATGEEAYSWTILFKSYLDDNNLNLELQIFASDIDVDAVEKAREGLYQENIETSIPPKFLDRYFTKEKDGYRVKKSIRESIIFADQNFLQDPPYSRLDMVSCRNVLIYLDNNLQQKAISIFHYALKTNGTLVLGNSESLGKATQYFKVVESKLKIFTKNDNINVKNHTWKMKHQRQNIQNPPKEVYAEPIAVLAKEFILDRFTPPSVVIDHNGEMLYVQGKTGKYLEFSTGEVKNNIVNVAREGLKIPLMNNIRKVRSKNKEIVHKNIRVKSNGNFEFVNLSISPLKKENNDTGLLLIIFEPSVTITQSSDYISESNTENAVILELEKELAEKEQYLQHTIEELETTNEELKSSNEEAESTNEELKSTNEELETSKEELQSVNEELSTTNNELTMKIDELAIVNNNLKNLLDATNIVTIFLDRNMKIFNFTPSVSEIMDLRHTDIGRSIQQFTNNLDYDNLVEDAKHVLKSLIPKEKEVYLSNKNYFWMRILPYITMENVLEGVVITFTNITEKKKSENIIKESEEKYRTTYENSPDSIIIHDFEMNIIDVNQKAIMEFGYSSEEFSQLKVLDLHPAEELSHSREVLGEMKSKEIQNVETKFKRKNGSVFWANATPCKYELNGKPIIHVVIRNTTELVETKNSLIKSQKRLIDAEILANIGNWEWDVTNDIVYWSQGLFKIFKIDPKQGAPNWSQHSKLYLKDSYEKLNKHVEDCYKKGISYEIEVDAVTSDGEIRKCIAKGYPETNSIGKIDRIYGVFQDITLHKNQLFLSKAQEIGAIGTWHLNIEENTLSLTEESYKIFGLPPGTSINYELFHDFIHPDDREYVNIQWTAALNREPYDIEYRILVDGEIKWVREKAELIFNEKENASAAFGVIQDITDRKQTEKAIVESQRLGAIGEMSSAIAHDFNNSLQSMTSFLELALLNTGLPEQVRTYLETANTVASEAANRVKLLQHFGGNTNKSIKSYSKSINTIINEVSIQSKPLWKNSAEKKGITITLETDLQKTNNIKVNDAGIESVLYNLIKNSVEAIVRDGKIKIETEILNQNVLIRISDTGLGMKEEIRSRVFQPFFSTKGFETGRGMGLSGAYSIVKDHNGEIYVKDTSPDKGTTIEMSLPISLTEEKKTESRETQFHKGIVKILWVDDDPLIRNVAFEILKSLGVEGDLADSGSNALALLEEKQYDLVVTDIGMPDMNGWQLCDIINEKQFGNMTLAVVSGWGAEIDEKTMEQHGVSFVVEKPFKIKQIHELIIKAVQ